MKSEKQIQKMLNDLCTNDRVISYIKKKELLNLSMCDNVVETAAKVLQWVLKNDSARTRTTERS